MRASPSGFAISEQPWSKVTQWDTPSTSVAPATFLPLGDNLPRQQKHVASMDLPLSLSLLMTKYPDGFNISDRLPFLNTYTWPILLIGLEV